MPPTMSDRAASRLPERADKPARATLRKSAASPRSTQTSPESGTEKQHDFRKPEEQREARRALLGAVLFEALVILRITRLKQQAAFIGKGLGRPSLDDRQLARWINGSEPAPWEELLTIRDLQFPLAQALLESCQRDLVEIRTSISRREPQRIAS